MPSSARAFVSEIASAHRRRQDVGEHGNVLIGLVGRGIGASRSPMMHQREAERLNIACTYALIDFDAADLPDTALGDVISAAEGFGFAGLNVTHPFKQAVLAHTTELAAEATAIGAVNTLVFRAGGRSGHNTDSWGFAESFRRDMAGCSLASVLLYGAGGGGAAVGHALLDLGAETLIVHDADRERAGRLAASLALRFGRPVDTAADAGTAVGTVSGIVNATPVGMAKYPGTPFDPNRLAATQWVADIVYFPALTDLLAAAGARGCRTLPGTGMAIFQAVRAFELFTGIAPDSDAMARHFEAAA